MYAYIKGKITELYNEEIVVETVSGIAYSLLIGPKSLLKLAQEHVGSEQAELDSLLNAQKCFYTSFIVREDAQLLYAFTSRQEKKLFELLLSIPRIGAKLAMNIVDNLTAAELIGAVLQDDTKSLESVKGLGKKVAERVLLELKGKMNKLQPLVGAELTAQIAKQAKHGTDDELVSETDVPINLVFNKKDKKPEQQMYEDLLSALMVLNFSLHESKQMLKLTFDPSLTVEDNLRKALQSR